MFFSPKQSNAKKNHLLFKQGVEGGTSMVPLKGEGIGWERLAHLFLANSGCRSSRGYAPYLRQPTTQEWKKLPGFNPAECHFHSDDFLLTGQGYSMRARQWSGTQPFFLCWLVTRPSRFLLLCQ